MALVSERLAYILDFNVQGAVKGLETVGKTADKELSKADQKLDKLGTNLTKFGAGAVAAAGVAGVALFKMGQGAADTEAGFSALNQVVGELSAQRLAEWAEDGAQKVGLAKGAIYEAATTFGMFGKEAGLAGVELENFAKSQITMAADWAAFKNTTPEQVIQDMRAAYAGSSETLQKYIGTVNDAAIKQAYFDETGKKITGTLTGQERIIGINALMMEKGADMAGQFARESGELAGQQVILKAQLKNMSDEIGAGVVPVLTALFGVANDVAGALGGMSSATNGLIGQVAAFSVGGLAAVGTLSLIAGQVIGMRENLRKAATAFTTFGTAAKVATVGAGALGVALVAGSVIYGNYRREKERARAITDDFTAALVAEKEGQEGASRAAIAGRLATAEFTEFMEAAGISAADAARYIQGETVPAIENLRARLTDPVDEIPAIKELIKGTDLSVGGVRDLVDELGDLRSGFIESEEAATRIVSANEALAETTDDSTEAIIAAHAEWREARRKADELEKALSETASALRNQRDEANRAFEGIKNLQSAFAALRGELSDRSAYLALQDEFDNVRQAAVDAYLAAESKADDAEQKARAYEQAQIALNQRIIDYAEDIADIPPETVTEVNALINAGLLEEAQAKLDALAAPRSAYIDTVVRTTSPGNREQAPRGSNVARKSGGPIPGPRDAPVPITAHGGEFVLSADVVDAVKRGGTTLGLGAGGGNASSSGGGGMTDGQMAMFASIVAAAVIQAADTRIGAGNVAMAAQLRAGRRA